MTPWIDAHVHLFPENNASKDWPRLGFFHNRVNTLTVYRAANGPERPSGAVVVHFSQAPDSSHVIETLEGLSPSCKPHFRGVIKADVKDPRTFAWALRDDVAGVRVYAKGAVPDFSDKTAWNRLWNNLRGGKKHIVVFGDAPYLRETIRQLPQDIPLVIDHLGLPDVSKGSNDHHFRTLLAEMKARNAVAAPVYYKGPGYRSSLDVRKVQPFVTAIAGTLGINRLILGATDAPFAGNALENDCRYHGKPLTSLTDFARIRAYTSALAHGIAEAMSLDEHNVLFCTHYRNAAELYGIGRS